MNEKIVYMGWIAYELKKRGFKYKRIEINPNRPEYNCYIYDETPELLKAFTEISNSRKASRQ